MTMTMTTIMNNTSEKFRRSRFFELMLRISNREVVVDGDGFIDDAKTGEKVDTDHHLDDFETDSSYLYHHYHHHYHVPDDDEAKDKVVETKTGEKVDTDHHLDDLDKKEKDAGAAVAAAFGKA
ncbi:hypothetical protein VTJ04DRAFT_6654 [Mycothermus thermophilus]|uniref:uncharacterized protein n=1 Tax=Humicola insolens TaxID=85995 RepID=UPI0037446816